MAPILCVDDEPNNLNLIRSILGDRHKLVFATSGTEALHAANKHNPSLILLDVEMPGLDGYEVARRIKAVGKTKDTPIIFVTGRDSLLDEETGFDVGGVDYITKPLYLSLIHI